MIRREDPLLHELRHRISIETNTITRTLGVPASSWAEYHACWAAMTTAGGREFRAARTTNPELSHEITIRWKSGITAQMRVCYVDPKPEGTTRYFAIVAVVDGFDRHWIRLHCKEINAGEWRAE
jgi:SPP1 family predicted phage head-tail adaptor